MKIALIAPPFIPVPPKAYGGTELFVAQLAEALADRGHEIVVYANGDSTVGCEVRSIVARTQWPLSNPGDGTLLNLRHTAWALHDAEESQVDAIHLNDAISVPFTSFMSTPSLLTLHHPKESELSALYEQYPGLHYVAISDHQRRQERMPRMRTIHHGVRAEDYPVRDRKDGYVCFLGRIAPIKGTHVAIAAAKRSGVPLKIAGEIQPTFRDYWEREIAPHVDGRMIEYVGEANQVSKRELLAGASALLFPIQWEEPFGLVMIEAMACGTPVLAFAGGAVNEVVAPGVSGWICRDVDELAARAAEPAIAPASCRDYVRRRFSVDRMAERYERAYEEAIAGARVPSAVRTSEIAAPAALPAEA
jgi:glycosyltransferase involved in cell wall biosynthesis